jgi:cytochrome d ubiquinol oxidase subunit I
MEALDTLILSRIQFAANISFHILFPTITIALGWVLFSFECALRRRVMTSGWRPTGSG